MPKTEGMKLAVLDFHGNPIKTWDSTRVGKETLAQLAAQNTEKRIRVGRWPFRRERVIQIEPDLAKAFTAALDECLLDVGRI